MLPPTAPFHQSRSTMSTWIDWSTSSLKIGTRRLVCFLSVPRSTVALNLNLQQTYRFPVRFQWLGGMIGSVWSLDGRDGGSDPLCRGVWSGWNHCAGIGVLAAALGLPTNCLPDPLGAIIEGPNAHCFRTVVQQRPSGINARVKMRSSCVKSSLGSGALFEVDISTTSLKDCNRLRELRLLRTVPMQTLFVES